MGARVRRDGWEHDLHEVIEGARQRPFSWGSHDCATWAARVRQSLTGAALPGFVGTYRTARGAARAIRASGAADLCDAVTREIGTQLASPALARRGDIVSDGAALGVCLGATAAFLGPGGLVFRSMAGCAMAWEV